MMLLCAPRHKEFKVSIDQGTLRWEPLTDDGASGPVQWILATGALPPFLADLLRDFPELIVAREYGRHAFELASPMQSEILRYLSEMTG
jgi:hypothetical protein